MMTINSDPFFNQRGQSTVEYLVIVMILLILPPTTKTIYQVMSHTMHDKYNSYAFAVSISDPPSKKFDDEVKKDINKVSHIINSIKQIGHIIGTQIIPDIFHGQMPSSDSIKDLMELIKKMF
ncbi:hypothetical protein [Desulfomarina sp.]